MSDINIYGDIERACRYQIVCTVSNQTDYDTIFKLDVCVAMGS